MSLTMGRRRRKRPSAGQRLDNAVSQISDTAQRVSSQSAEALKSAPQRAEGLKNAMVNKILQVDDGVQSFVRTKALGLMDDGSVLPEGEALGTLREFLGATVFAQRPGGPSKTAYALEDSAAGQGAAVAARALQTGAVTGAGIGLMNLGGMVFGGEADQQERGQMPLY